MYFDLAYYFGQRQEFVFQVFFFFFFFLRTDDLGVGPLQPPLRA